MAMQMKNGLIAIALVLIAGLLTFGLKALKPEVKKRHAKPSIPIVSTVELFPSSHSVQIEVNGTVIPVRKIELLTEVEGMAVHVNPDMVNGGIVKKGDLLLRIDSADYDFDIRNKRALVTEAKLNLEIEKAQHNIALKQWDDLNDGSSEQVNMSLALREPQLENALAKLDAAESSLEAALLAKKRTFVTSPFNALVLEQNVSKGQLVTRQNPVATIVDTDEFWIQASVPLDKLRWISFPLNAANPGAQANVYQNIGGGYKSLRKAEVYKLHGELDPKGRMAKVLLRLPDPLCLKGCEMNSMKLLLGSFVNVLIDAGRIDNAFAIPRSAIRDNSKVWILTKDNNLEIRDVEIAWLRKDDVLVIKGVSPGERIITSSLQSPLPGMALRAEGQKTEKPSDNE